MQGRMSKSLLDEYVAVDVTLINDLYLRSTERVRSFRLFQSAYLHIHGSEAS